MCKNFLFFRKAGRVVSIEEQQEELKKLKKEVELLRTSVSKQVGSGGDDIANVEREIAKINREHDEVIKDMDSMRINFREKSNLVGDCETLQMMIGYVKVFYGMLFKI